MDEDVIHTLLAFPLWEVTDLEKPAGTGDKKILREVSATFPSNIFISPMVFFRIANIILSKRVFCLSNRRV